MTYLIILALVAIALSTATIRSVRRDGRGPARPPRSRLDDPQLLPPSARTS